MYIYLCVHFYMHGVEQRMTKVSANYTTVHSLHTQKNYTKKLYIFTLSTCCILFITAQTHTHTHTHTHMHAHSHPPTHTQAHITQTHANTNQSVN